ncbi:hypothetical protein CXK94_21045 [Stutzerimonas stutzeri]|uniref:Periplasmic protein-like protein n=1 Tax=Stutzerimonas stutzeri TaxID=316 RepID=A0A2N8SRI9_STUST|nr:hypothetical protein [Stutzerimonas stutzeri]MCQ4327563.1 hypothetical protein [Stutzerimonas stutzeri]PNG05103.1 hypothetical protein CXK94_21045 [Stutzerimonas stutzeri]
MLRFVICCALALHACLSQADVAVLEMQHATHGRMLVARVTEQIAPGDYEALLAGITAHPGRYARKLLILDNIGGSAAEAMRMGYLLRETGFEALVPRSAVCQGSCVYLLAAGRQRTVRGHVALHRPYLANGDSALSGGQQPRRTPQAYFRDMGMHPSLAKDMQRFEPWRMHLLTPRELARYRLQ